MRQVETIKHAERQDRWRPDAAVVYVPEDSHTKLSAAEAPDINPSGSIEIP
jgi:hypothetical protein